MSLLGPQLEAFLAIARLKTVHGAADMMHLTQTAVTQRIRSLEAKLKTTLFIRTRRGMKLTPEGEALIHYCHTVKSLEGETLSAISHAGTLTDIEISITGPSSLMMSRIIPSCIPILKKFPHLRMRFDIDDIEKRHQKLKRGEVDFAIIEPENAGQEMMTKALKSEQYILIGSCSWKNRTVREIIANEKIIDFDPSDQATFNYLKSFKLFTHTQHTRHFVNNTESIALLIKEGLGYSVLTKEFAASYIASGECIPLNSGKIYHHHHSLAWYSRPEPPFYFQSIIKAIN